MNTPTIHDLLAALDPDVEIDPVAASRIRSAVEAELQPGFIELPRGTDTYPENLSVRLFRW
jgi:hypothetical protein